jgi:hypothetical protein
MGRRLTIALLASGLLVVAMAGNANGGAASGIRGVLLDTTCAGPCTPCSAASPCPPPCPPCTARVCPERQRGAAIPCPAARSICADCGTQPQPYTGADAHVVVRRVSNGKVVARRAPTDGKFAVRLGRGRYRVHGFVSQPCWQGTTQTVSVHRSAFTTVELAVRNTCVVTPQASRRQ